MLSEYLLASTTLCLPLYVCHSIILYLSFLGLIYLSFFMVLSFAHRIAPLVINISIDIIDKRIVFPSNALQQGGGKQTTSWLIPPTSPALR